MSELTMMEGSLAVALSVGVCRPNVISAYPITPQTHIVEDLAKLVAEGDLAAEFINVESEHSAASVVLGASATGARSYTATTSQGLLLMTEVLYNIAGMRMPVVLTCANRAVSAPLSIWNDHQDSFSVRDSGWIQLYAEDNQEVSDMHPQAFRIGEDPDVLMPVMVCMDGFLLTHTYEPIEVLDQDMVDSYLPRFEPEYRLSTADPKSFGCFLDPVWYMEGRYAIEAAIEGAREKVRQAAKDFTALTGRDYGCLIDEYRSEDAETILVAMGSLVSELRDFVDSEREAGRKVGLVKIRCFRPFPKEELLNALGGARHVIVLEKAVSLGYGSILGPEIKALFYGRSDVPAMDVYTAGMGGREILPETLSAIIGAGPGDADGHWLGLKPELLEGRSS